MAEPNEKVRTKKVHVKTQRVISPVVFRDET
jgi:hypothetical protein